MTYFFNLVFSCSFRYCYFVLILGINNYCYSQVIVSGKIENQNGAALERVSVVVRDTSNTITAFNISKHDGFYSVKISTQGKYFLEFSSIGFTTYIIPIEIVFPKNIVENVRLTDRVIEINEVLVTASKPVVFKSDTTIFNVAAFRQGNEGVLEDLLKKIPGLSISDDGTIRVGNNEIEKIMVEGDDFFGKGYKLLSKNMPPDKIEKIELLNHFNDKRLLRGIENSDKVALNLKLNDTAKNIWFGNILGGIGTEKRIDSKINLMNFSKKVKYYFTGNLNNVGYDATGNLGILAALSSSTEVGDNNSAKKIVEGNIFAVGLNPKRYVFNRLRFTSLNSIYTLSPKVKLGVIGLLNFDTNDFIKNAFQSFKIGAINFTNTEAHSLQRAKFTGFTRLNLDYAISEKKHFEYVVKYNNYNEKDRNNLYFNDVNSTDLLRSRNILLDQKASYSFKTNKKEVFVFTFRNINESLPQRYEIRNFNFGTLFDTTKAFVPLLEQNSNNRMKFTAFEVHYLNKMNNGDLFELKVGSKYRFDEVGTQLNISNENQLVTSPEGFQNNISMKTVDTYGYLHYLKKIRTVSIRTEIDFHLIKNNLSFQVSNNEIRAIIPLFNPKLLLEIDLKNQQKLRTFISNSTQLSKVSDISNTYFVSAFRTFNKGLEQPNTINNSAFGLNHVYGKAGQNVYLNSNLYYVKHHNFFSTNTVVKPNYLLVEKILLRDKQNFIVASSIESYLEGISSTFKFNTSINWSSYTNIINSTQLRKIISNEKEIGTEIRSGFDGVFNYHIGAKLKFSQITTNLTNSFTNNLNFMDCYFKINQKLDFSVQAENYNFHSRNNKSTNFYFVDFSGKYVLKENKISLLFQGNNLLNNTSFTNYNVNDISFSSTTYRLQPRYFLIKVEVRL